jgi:membrane-associated phospholipid phosphatase
MFVLLTNAINGLLLLLTAAAPLLPRPQKPGKQKRGKQKLGKSAFDFWLRSFLGIGIGVALAESGKHFSIWPGRPTFPSGHETLALAAGTCLVLWNPRWLAVVLPLAALQAWALVAGHFHRPVDVAGALITGILPPLGCHFYQKPLSDGGRNLH